MEKSGYKAGESGHFPFAVLFQLEGSEFKKGVELWFSMPFGLAYGLERFQT